MNKLNKIFNKKVKDSFKSIIEENDLKILREDYFIICFSNNYILIEICYDGNFSYEINLRIGLLQDNELSFSADVLYAYYQKDMPGFTITDEEGLDRFFKKTTNLLKSDAKKLLNADLNEFMNIKKFNDNECEKYNFSIQLRHAKNEANTAWKEKKYSRFVEVLEPFKSNLSPAEVKKLEYSIKHIKN